MEDAVETAGWTHRAAALWSQHDAFFASCCWLAVTAKDPHVSLFNAGGDERSFPDLLLTPLLSPRSLSSMPSIGGSESVAQWWHGRPHGSGTAISCSRIRACCYFLGASCILPILST